MNDYLIYLLTDEKTFFVGKVKVRLGKTAYRNHKAGQYLPTKEWFKNDASNIKIYWLENASGTRREVYQKEVIYTKYFLSEKLDYSYQDSDLYFHANDYTFTGNENFKTLEEIMKDEESQEEFIKLIEENEKERTGINVYVNFNEDEAKEIRKASEKTGLPMTQVVKQFALKGKVEVHDNSELINIGTTLSEIDQSLKHLVFNDYPNKELVRSAIIGLTESQDELVLTIRKLLLRMRREVGK